MFFSLALVLLGGTLLGELARRCKLPPLLGMLIAGILLGHFQLLDDSLLAISADLRKIALIIILTRAGLNLSLSELKQVGRPAVLLCFLPACLEIGAMMVFAPAIFGISLVEAGILGAVVAAVSPAVIVPAMLKLSEEGYGKAIPQMIMAGASVDDVFVIVIFTAFLGLAQGGALSAAQFLDIPISLVLGIAVGLLLGYFLGKLYAKTHMRDSLKVVLLLGISFILVSIEDKFADYVAFSSLLAIMAMGIPLQKIVPEKAIHVSKLYDKLWVAAQIWLFVLVGATVDLAYAKSAGIWAVAILFMVLIFRMGGVFLCLLGTKLTVKERCFCAIAYCPKATVQAAIGAIPLSMGLACGNLVVTIAVLAILITAPAGAFAVEHTYKRWLTK
ncbi:MAG: cation:proton antiporter [Eubacteriales bacterium]